MTIGKLIENELNRQQWNKSEFAKQLGITRNGLYGILSRMSIDTELLFRISILLNYDFFKAYSIRFNNKSKTLAETVIEPDKTRNVDVEIRMRMPKYLVKDIGLADFIKKNNSDLDYSVD